MSPVNYASHLEVPQTEALEGQVENSAGGFSFAVDSWQRLDRFLILGAEGGSYYASEKKLSRENAQAVQACIREDGIRAVQRIVEISESGRAVKNDPALFALALAAKVGDSHTRAAAYAALPKVARIGTHLFTFAEYAQSLGGWGRGMRSAVSDWYLDKPLKDVAYQVVKYRQRNGWSHRDLLRLAHPKTKDADTKAVFQWIVKGKEGFDATLRHDHLPTSIVAYEAAQIASPKGVVELLEANKGALPWEALPTEALKHAEVWGALLPNLPYTAMIRNLGRMGANGLLVQGSDAARTVVQKLSDTNALRKSKIHPINILSALKVYANGKGERGSLTWTPVQKIADALDDAFYAAFENVESTGKNWVIGCDVSGSMTLGNIAGIPGLTPRDVTGALALVFAKREPGAELMAFSHEFVPLEISPKMRLDTVINIMARMSFGGTDCALPILWAQKNNFKADAFVTLTDSETWAGPVHPTKALEKYRKAFGPAKNVVVGMVSNGFTVNDPTDILGLDIVGADASLPAIIEEFVR